MSGSAFHQGIVPSDVHRLPNPKKEDVVKPFTDENTGQVNFKLPVVRAIVRKP